MNYQKIQLHFFFRLALVFCLLGAAFLTPGPGRSQAVGSISVSPGSSPGGKQVLVSGSFPGYGAFDSVVVWGGAVSTGRRLGSAPLRADGSFSLPVVIPPEAPLGSYTLVADVNYGYASAFTTVQVTAAVFSAAYIYDSDTQTAADFKSLLDGQGFATTLIQVNSLATSSLSGYDLILAGGDTGTGYTWDGSAAAIQKLRTSGKPIIGLGMGGASLFSNLNLSIGYGESWLVTSGADAAVIDPAHPAWNRPYAITAPNNQVSLYTSSTAYRATYLPQAQANLLPLGRQVNNANHYPVIEQDGRYLLWGYYLGPSAMTPVGTDLFANLAWHLVWARSVDTLILTDFNRMQTIGYARADVTDLQNTINNLVGQSKTNSNMTALRRDLSTEVPAEMETGCDGWKAGGEGDVATNNTCVGAIDTYIENLKASSYPNLFFLIISGATEVIPMKAREQDHLFSAQEKLWGAGLPAPDSYIKQLYSTPGTVNGWGHYLTDSIYGDLSYIDDGWGAQHELVPELGVGRLVETPPQITSQIDTYLANHAYFSRSERVSMASSDYVDGGRLAADYMGAGTDDDLLASSYDSNDIPPKLNAAYSLVYLGGHGDYNVVSTGGESFMAGNHASYGDTAALGNLPNAVIVTSGCHNGASFGNQLYAPPSGTTYAEFPEEFASKQVGVYIGSTGYTAITPTGGSEDTSLVDHNEKLSTYMIMHLYQDGNITAGEAFRRAVNSYVTDLGSIGTIARRVISITNLYGIPNYRAPLTFEFIHPWFVAYWLYPWWIDPPPYVDPEIIHYRVEVRLEDWEIRVPGAGPEWYLHIPGAFASGAPGRQTLPVIKTSLLLPLGSVLQNVEFNQDGAVSQSWTADGPMYVPPVSEDPLQIPGEQGVQTPHGGLPAAENSPQISLSQPYEVFTTTALGGAGMEIGLSVMPLIHNGKTLSTTLYTTAVFTLTIQTGASTDDDGDGLPTYWEGSYGLDPLDGGGDQGADGDPDQDGLTNSQEFPLGTNPQDPDTDNDGWSDGAEEAIGTNPLNPGDYPRQIFIPLVR